MHIHMFFGLSGNITGPEKPNKQKSMPLNRLGNFNRGFRVYLDLPM